MAVEPTPDLARVIEERDFSTLHEMLKHWSPPSAAGFIESLLSDLYGPHWLLVALTVGVALVGIVGELSPGPCCRSC